MFSRPRAIERFPRDDDAEPDIDVLPRPPPRQDAVALFDYAALQLVVVPLALATIAWICQHGSADMALARLFADPTTHRFAWRDSLLLDVFGHQAARGLPFLVGGIALAAGLAGFAVRPLAPWRRILLAVGVAMLLGPIVVNALKGLTSQHCPIALQSFGGVIDDLASASAPFWAASHETAGHCLPSGHAAGGYALLALYFAGWAAGRPAWRWRGLAIGVAAGLLFSVVRMMQGAHFASATLWSAAVDWTVCALVFLPLLCLPKKRA